MPVLFPYLIGGAIAYLLFVKKAVAKPCPPEKPCVCPACNGQGQVVLTDDSGAACGNAACLACAGAGQTVNPELNDAGRYDSPPPTQVDVCGLLADAKAGSLDARAVVDELRARGRLSDEVLNSCLTSPALATDKSTVMADGGQGFSPTGSNALLDTRTAGGAGLTVLPAVNAVSPVLPGFDSTALKAGAISVGPIAPPVNTCGLVLAAAGNNREAAGQLRTMLDNGMVRLTDLDKCNVGLSVSDQLRVQKMVTL